MDMHHIEAALRFLLTLLGRAMAIPIGILRTGILLLGLPLLQGILAMFSTVYTTLDPVNPTNKDRLINSYTEEQCYYLFRFTKVQLTYLVARLNLPASIKSENGSMCPGEHALLVYLYHLTCPVILLKMQNEFGREQTQISRIEKEITRFLTTTYRPCVIDNLWWYEDRILR
jgi:hypothetical protein